MYEPSLLGTPNICFSFTIVEIIAWPVGQVNRASGNKQYLVHQRRIFAPLQYLADSLDENRDRRILLRVEMVTSHCIS